MSQQVETALFSSYYPNNPLEKQREIFETWVSNLFTTDDLKLIDFNSNGMILTKHANGL